MGIPHHFEPVAVGDRRSRELSAVMYCYLVARNELRPGAPFTAKLANDAIEWWNKLSGDEKRAFEATLAATYVYRSLP